MLPTPETSPTSMPETPSHDSLASRRRLAPIFIPPSCPKHPAPHPGISREDTKQFQVRPAHAPGTLRRGANPRWRHAAARAPGAARLPLDASSPLKAVSLCRRIPRRRRARMYLCRRGTSSTCGQSVPLPNLTPPCQRRPRVILPSVPCRSRNRAPIDANPAVRTTSYLRDALTSISLLEVCLARIDTRLLPDWRWQHRCPRASDPGTFPYTSTLDDPSRAAQETHQPPKHALHLEPYGSRSRQPWPSRRSVYY